MRIALVLLLVLSLLLASCDYGTPYNEEEDGPIAQDPWWPVTIPTIAIIFMVIFAGMEGLDEQKAMAHVI